LSYLLNFFKPGR